MYYLGQGQCQGKWDVQGYQAALTEWEAIESKVGKRTYKTPPKFFYNDPKEQEARSRLYAERSMYEVSLLKPPSFEQWREQQAALAVSNQQPVPKSHTTRAWADDFLNFKEGQVKGKILSSGRYGNIKTNTERFVSFVGNDTPIENINAATLASYHSHLLAVIDKGSLSTISGKEAIQTAKQFITRCFELGGMELPRNIKSRDLNITSAPTILVRFSTKELVKLVNELPELYRSYPLKLYLLLMMNCGMTQIDVADLRNDEIEVDINKLEKANIKRKRSKTHNQANVPIVQYRLWRTCQAPIEMSGTWRQ